MFYCTSIIFLFSLFKYVSNIQHGRLCDNKWHRVTAQHANFIRTWPRELKASKQRKHQGKDCKQKLLGITFENNSALLIYIIWESTGKEKQW